MLLCYMQAYPVFHFIRIFKIVWLTFPCDSIKNESQRAKRDNLKSLMFELHGKSSQNVLKCAYFPFFYKEKGYEDQVPLSHHQISQSK